MTGTQHQPGDEISLYEFDLNDHTTNLKCWHNFEEISHNELDPVRHPVHGGVVAGELYLGGVNVYGDHSLTGEGELDCVSSNSTKTINNNITPREKLLYMSSSQNLRIHTCIFQRYVQRSSPV